MSDLNYRILSELRKNVIKIPVDNDVICSICNKILINARSAPCGCRYCLACITEHLNKQNNFCPGKSIDCKEKMILLNDHINTDYAINRKISTMVVKCPADKCEFIDEVRNIGSHMETCNLNIPKINIEMENKIKSLENEIEKLGSNMKTIDEEIRNLKIDKGALQNNIWEIEKNTNNCFDRIKNMKKEIFDDSGMRAISLKDWMDMTTPLHIEVQQQFNFLKGEINGIMEKMTKLEDIQNQLKSSIENNLSEIKKPNKCTNYYSEDDDPKNQSKIRRTYSWEIEKFFSNVRPNLLTSHQTFSSDSFFTHKKGYKVHLELDFNAYASGSGTPIYISYCVMEGNDDDSLLWPCKFDVKFVLINPYNNEMYCSSNIYNENYPTHPGKKKPDIESFPIGCRLAKLEDIYNIREWRICDKLIVECTISLDRS